MDANENSATYNNPTLALKSEFVMSIENFVFSVQ